MTELQERLIEVRDRLFDGVQLVAVSKFHPASSIVEAYDAGQRVFGESRVQELQEKQQLLPADIEWHFIGHLQVNKVKYIVPYISLIHAVDSLRLLQEIDRQSAKNSLARQSRGLSERVSVLLQLHVAQEDSKFGFAPSECKAFLDSGEWRKLEHVEIAGIMCMATNTDDEAQIAEEFFTAQKFFLMAKERYFKDCDGFCQCSWGMSDDYEIAMEHGSTLVRVGSYIFGARDYSQPPVSPVADGSLSLGVCAATVSEDAAKEAEFCYQEGLACAQRSEWGKAASFFRKALVLDPGSKAGESLGMIEDIFNYYHKDNFNP